MASDHSFHLGLTLITFNLPKHSLTRTSICPSNSGVELILPNSAWTAEVIVSLIRVRNIGIGFGWEVGYIKAAFEFRPPNSTGIGFGYLSIKVEGRRVVIRRKSSIVVLPIDQLVIPSRFFVVSPFPAHLETSVNRRNIPDPLGPETSIKSPLSNLGEAPG
jgi:hypothetical protein